MKTSHSQCKQFFYLYFCVTAVFCTSLLYSENKFKQVTFCVHDPAQGPGIGQRMTLQNRKSFFNHFSINLDQLPLKYIKGDKGPSNDDDHIVLGRP